MAIICFLFFQWRWKSPHLYCVIKSGISLHCITTVTTLNLWCIGDPSVRMRPRLSNLLKIKTIFMLYPFIYKVGTKLCICEATPTLSSLFRVLFASFSSSWANTTGRLLGPNSQYAEVKLSLLRTHCLRIESELSNLSIIIPTVYQASYRRSWDVL